MHFRGCARYWTTCRLAVNPIAMTIGEPQHAFPEFVPEVLAAHVSGFNKYPPNDGAPELLEAIASWVGRRFGAKVDAATEVLTLNGNP